jgi:hypothetical protein
METSFMADSSGAEAYPAESRVQMRAAVASLMASLLLSPRYRRFSSISSSIAIIIALVERSRKKKTEP